MKQLSAPQYRAFRDNVVALIEMDSRVDLLEWSLRRILLGHLDRQFLAPRPAQARYSDPAQLAKECALVLSVMAHAGARDSLAVEEAFDAAVRAYIARWAYRHPTPKDFFRTMNDVAGEDLDWFWNDWFVGNGYIDLAVRGVKHTGGGYAVSIANIGGMDAPVDLVLRFPDGSTRTVHETPGIWAADPRNTTVTVHTNRPLTSLTLDGGIWMDADRSNDSWTAATGERSPR